MIMINDPRHKVCTTAAQYSNATGCSRERAAGRLCTGGIPGLHPSPPIASNASVPTLAVTCAHLPDQNHSTCPVLSAPLARVGGCFCVLVSIFGCKVGSGCCGWCGSELWLHSPGQDKEVKHTAAPGASMFQLCPRSHRLAGCLQAKGWRLQA